jgi:hypothetical protein
MEKECKKNICYCLNEKCTCKHNEVLKNSALFYRDEFAIGFAEWLITDWHNDERWSIITDRKELLKIYKEEKGL